MAEEDDSIEDLCDTIKDFISSDSEVYEWLKTEMRKELVRLMDGGDIEDHTSDNK